ncbi:type I secretion system permease/ATPase [Pseudooceanicola aestuarii]|uniref:type I secretion system permease/ATPase n=1 Tax=Pseudooceanicola aestuarii TaxID=2697319 RepID=UPI0013D5C6F6|nr:type I secretion system permease/ATPase [Pseudooceanicola aestuarii]
MARDRAGDRLVTGLVALCQAHDVEASAARLTDGVPLRAGRLDMAQVPQALRRVNMGGRALDVALADLSPYALPVLLLTRDGGSLVLEQLTRDSATVILPETGSGRTTLTRAELEETYLGRAVMAKPLDVVTPRVGDMARGKDRHWILGPVLDNWAIYRDVFIAAFMANALAVLTAIFAMQVYDRVVPNQAMDTLWILASGVGLAIVLEFLLRIMRARLIDISGRDLDLRLSAQLFHKVVNLKLSHQPKSVGVFANQVREFSSVREFFTSQTAGTISDLPFVVIFIAVMAFIGGPIALVVLTGAVMIILPGIVLQKYLARMSRQNTREGSALNGLLLEAVGSLETVKAARAESRLERAYGQLTATMAASSIRARQVTTMLTQGASSVQQITYIGVIITGVYQIGAGNLTVGSLIACSILTGRTLSPATQVCGLLAKWQYVRSAMEALDSIMKMPVERDNSRHYVRADRMQGAYALQDVTYSHDPEQGDAVAIAGLQIPAGQNVAVIGGNGAGKSTLLRLLSGMLEPQSGAITLDGLALHQVDPIDRRRQIGYLPQQVALFQGTLRDNLCLDHGQHDDAALFAALDAVGLGPHVRKHVRGLDLRLESGGNVSGGQKQAIGLARLILQDPRIVIMDEPTSAFDNVNEQKVITFLSTWLEGRTAIISTHRKELLALTERAVVLKDGAVLHDDSLNHILAMAKRPAATASNIKAVP